jgi:hypothetical protein
MKASWQMPGKATGRVRCIVSLPSIDDRKEFSEVSIIRIRKLLGRYLPTAGSALEGASFVISAEMRAPKRGARWRPIARWRAPDAIAPVLERAACVLDSLPKEPNKHVNWRTG